MVYRLLSRWRWRIFIVALLALSESLFHNRSRQYKLNTPLDKPFAHGCSNASISSTGRANATLLMLARNSDLKGAVSALQSVERRFNNRFHYPLVVLNNVPFSNEFRATVTASVSGQVEFAIVPPQMWSFPSHMDASAMKTALERQRHALHGSAADYHHMCRFFSGFFYDIPVLQRYRWYWRIEPDVEFTCDIAYDPFVEMQNQGKRYGYAIALWELVDTVPSLFRTISQYRQQIQTPSTRLWDQLLIKSSLPWPLRIFLRYVPNRNDDGDTWNLCHFWSNFEIADLEWFRSPEYRDLFAYLDAKGGFYLERWGDAPVHTFAAALLLRDNQIHHFQDIGYIHPPFQYIPTMPSGQHTASPMRNLQYQSLEKWNEHSKIIGCSCDIDMEAAGVIQPTCMNRIMEAFT